MANALTQTAQSNNYGIPKISFAPLPDVIAATGMELGSITQLGLSENWVILIDGRVLQLENVVIGGGLTRSKTILPNILLTQLPQTTASADWGKD